MTTSNARPKGAQLIGSVPLGSVEEVMTTLCDALGQHIERLPDGELGNRAIWIAWQRDVFNKLEGKFEDVDPAPDAYVQRPRLHAKYGVTAADIDLGPLGYAEAAIESYAVFKRLKGEGKIPTHVRFQVGLPAPQEPAIGHFETDTHALMGPIYEKELMGELDQILDAIPLSQLAIQWEFVYQLAILEDAYETIMKDPWSEIPARLAALTDAVPEPAQVGYHFCYGDSGHRHFKQPADMGIMVRVANGIVSGVHRQVTWMHMPVPRDRTDDAYFAPLKDLKLPEGTDFFLGLIHNTDGLEGAQARVTAASKSCSSFGIATECGLSRRPAETVPGLLKIHTQLADPR
jgi:hypothetical protein